jgi:hypothetical protein
MKKRLAGWAMALGTVLSMGCVGIPEGIKPVVLVDAKAAKAQSLASRPQRLSNHTVDTGLVIADSP